MYDENLCSLRTRAFNCDIHKETSLSTHKGDRYQYLPSIREQRALLCHDFEGKGPLNSLHTKLADRPIRPMAHNDTFDIQNTSCPLPSEPLHGIDSGVWIGGLYGLSKGTYQNGVRLSLHECIMWLEHPRQELTTLPNLASYLDFSRTLSDKLHSSCTAPSHSRRNLPNGSTTYRCQTKCHVE